MYRSTIVSVLVVTLSAILSYAGHSDDGTGGTSPGLAPAAPSEEPATHTHDGFYKGGMPEEDGTGEEPGLAPDSPRQEAAPRRRDGFYRGGMPEERDVRPGLGGSRWFGPRDVPAGPPRRPDRGSGYYHYRDRDDGWDRDEYSVGIRVRPHSSLSLDYYRYGYPSIAYRPAYRPHYRFGLSLGSGCRPYGGFGWGLSLGFHR